MDIKKLEDILTKYISFYNKPYLNRKQKSKNPRVNFKLKTWIPEIFRCKLIGIKNNFYYNTVSCYLDEILIFDLYYDLEGNSKIVDIKWAASANLAYSDYTYEDGAKKEKLLKKLLEFDSLF